MKPSSSVEPLLSVSIGEKLSRPNTYHSPLEIWLEKLPARIIVGAGISGIIAAQGIAEKYFNSGKTRLA